MRYLLLGFALGLCACPGEGTPPATSPAPDPSVGTTATVLAPGATASAEAATPNAGTPCGALDCRRFATPAAAFAHVLAARPRVLAVGEVHAPKGARVPSATARFAEALLPLLKDGASDLVIELMLPPKGCQQTTAEVRQEHQQVTEQQADDNQNEFVTLGRRSKALGVAPHMLQPTCDDLGRVRAAGPDGVAETLAMIARLTEVKARELLERNAGAANDRMVIAYGGAMHNDVAPPEARRAWSFGPQLHEASAGRYVEIDLIVPEFIRDSPSWQALPWFSHFDPAAHADQTLLYRPAEGAYVLIFPRSAPAPAPAGSAPAGGE